MGDADVDRRAEIGGAGGRIGILLEMAMRIAMLTWESLHSIAVGGVAAHVTELSAALARRGHEVHVFTRLGPGQKHYERIYDVHYHRCPYPASPEIVDDVNNMCRVFVDRVFAVEDMQGRFDVVHAHDWLACNAMIWFKQGRQCVGFFTVHSTEYGRCGNTFASGRSHRIRTQERAGTYWADRVIAVSQATKQELGWMYEVPDWKVSVVYNGVSPHRFDLELDAGAEKHKYQIGPLDPTVLFCGRLTYQKGPDILLEAVPWVLRACPQARFVFAGDGEMRGQLERRAAQLGAGHAVRFLGFRQGDDLVRLFKMADVVCVPSRNEPFGIVVLEAWSARKPVVVTQVGGPNEYVGHDVNGLKIFPRPDSVAWGLATMFRDFDRARAMGENGRRAVEASFTWDHIAQEVLLLYASATNLPAAVDMPARPAAPQPPESAAVADAIQTNSQAPEAAYAAAAEHRSAVYAAAELGFEPEGPAAAAARQSSREVLTTMMLVVEEKEDRVLVWGEADSVWDGLRRCHQEAEHSGTVLRAQVTMLSQAAAARPGGPHPPALPVLPGLVPPLAPPPAPEVGLGAAMPPVPPVSPVPAVPADVAEAPRVIPAPVAPPIAPVAPTEVPIPPRPSLAARRRERGRKAPGPAA
jgi:glycosyltransferase involved in cell wall biosynthesis